MLHVEFVYECWRRYNYNWKAFQTVKNLKNEVFLEVYFGTQEKQFYSMNDIYTNLFELT